MALPYKMWPMLNARSAFFHGLTVKIFCLRYIEYLCVNAWKLCAFGRIEYARHIHPENSHIPHRQNHAHYQDESSAIKDFFDE